jgi:phosphoribosylanthranilate isomerase
MPASLAWVALATLIDIENMNAAGAIFGGFASADNSPRSLNRTKAKLLRTLF